MCSPRLLSFVLSALVFSLPVFTAPPVAAAKPKLVVGIIIDQFRYDYLTRFRGEYHGGLHQLMTEGADFTNAFYAQVPTVTAVGHSIFMSGAMPAVSGIVGNSWYQRSEHQIVTSVCDWNEKTVGGRSGEIKGRVCTDADPASPRRLLVTTLGDELLTASPQSKVIGVSIKPRGAILPSGHRAAGAYWFDDASGNFVSSTYYMPELPAWVSSFNQKKLAAKYVEQPWTTFPNWKVKAPEGSQTPYQNLEASPWGNELIEQFAESAINGEQLGQRGALDLLTVSFSSNDYVGHRVGPNAPEVRDMAIRVDQQLGKLFRTIDTKIGLKNTIIVVSADHGVAPEPDEKGKMPGGYLSANVDAVVSAALDKRFGKEKWLIPGGGESGLYLNYEAIESAKGTDGKPLSVDEIYGTAKDAIFAAQDLHAARVYSRKQLDNGIGGDYVAQAEMNGYYPARGADLFIVYEPYFIPGSSGTSHYTPYAYDRHVPILFMGPGIKPGEYNGTVAPNDIAPTLATMISVQTPSGSAGKVLMEMLTR
ncbi:MAG: alkaline phosphatase family protein [Bryobacteraceae bacterium]